VQTIEIRSDFKFDLLNGQLQPGRFHRDAFRKTASTECCNYYGLTPEESVMAIRSRLSRMFHARLRECAMKVA